MAHSVEPLDTRKPRQHVSTHGGPAFTLGLTLAVGWACVKFRRFDAEHAISFQRSALLQAILARPSPRENREIPGLVAASLVFR
jgi:hypothetical protein